METNAQLVQAYERIRRTLSGSGFNVSDHKSIDYGLQFTVSIHEWSGTVRIYQNKKGLIKIDYSQIKGDEHAKRIESLIQGEGVGARSKNQEMNPSVLGFPIIGTDESGKGDYFGPLVGAGVYVDVQSAKHLVSLGVKDSKELSDGRAIELSHDIVRICRGRLAVIEISAERYNDLYDQLVSEHKNLNVLLAWAHARAIEEVLSKVTCRVAVADQFADEKFILEKLQERGRQVRLIQMHRAEQNVAVAAASVLARARFLEKLSRLSHEYGIDLPKGASQAVVEAAKQFVNAHGKESLRKVAKLHFKTTAEVIG